ncbi:hypothetical protein [Chloroflexus sp.]|uniref:hypothetical protein n=1 Tax=Chloroflexus sp. TaxID=1904827 RepID=UPI00404B97E2
MASQQATQPAKPPAKPKRRFGCTLWLFVFAVLTLGLLGVGFLQPVKLAIAQEYIVGFTRGGIRETVETTSVDSCIRIADSNELVSIPRTRRVTTYNNGTVLEITFSDQPLPAECN